MLDLSLLPALCRAAHSPPAMFWLFGLLRGLRVPWGAEGVAQAVLCPLPPACAHSPGHPLFPPVPGTAAPSRDGDAGSFLHPLRCSPLPEFSLHRWGLASHFLARGSSLVSLAASLPRSREKAGKRVQPVSPEHGVPVLLAGYADELRVVPGAVSPWCRAHPSVLWVSSRTAYGVMLCCSG